MPEREPRTVLRLVIMLIAGAILCSVLCMADVVGLITSLGAIGFAGLSLILMLRFGAALGSGPGNRDDRRLAELSRRCYELAVRVSYSQRRARDSVRGMLDRSNDVLGRCSRLRKQVREVRYAAGESASPPGSAALSDDEACAGAPTDRTGWPIGPMLQEVMSSVREMAVVLRDVDHNAKELITSTEETAFSMSRLDSFLQDMAGRGRDLESSTEAANRVALEGTKVVEEMGRENEAIITTVNEAASAVEDLGRWSQEVGKIVEVIRDIADETNLLALNASIIAAQSGEHGKAFGVVAEEIRGLAERTSSSTKEISDLVTAVQKNVANVVNGMKKSLQRVERGELLTRNAGTVLEKVFESFESSRNLAKQIATSTFEHKIDSSQVVRSLHKVTDIARRLQTHDYAERTGAGETLGMARTLNALCEWGGTTDKAPPPGPDRKNGMPGSPETTRHEVRIVNSTRLLEAMEDEIDSCISLLNRTRDALKARLRNLDECVDMTASGMIEPTEQMCISDFDDCWNIVACRRELRESCPAYKEHDRCMFFSKEAACARGVVPAKKEAGASPIEGPSGGKDQITHEVGSGR